MSFSASVYPWQCSSFSQLRFHESSKPSTPRFTASADVPDFLSTDWLESRKKKPFGPRLSFSAEEAVQNQLDALKFNDHPREDYGIEVMYRFAGFDPFERSTYFGRFFDLGQVSMCCNAHHLRCISSASKACFWLHVVVLLISFRGTENLSYFFRFERFRRIFHHSTYRVLLGHREREILSSLYVNENSYKQRIWVQGARPEEEETFQFTMVQRVGGSWDGYWLTESLLNDGENFSGGVAY